MKQIHKNIILSAGLLFASAGLMAQTDVEKTDTLAQKVNVAFRTVDRADLMGGVSSVNVEELTNKSYSLYSLDNMQSLVGGYNGQLWNMGEALVLVDGVPREANNIRPTEIHSSKQRKPWCFTAAVVRRESFLSPRSADAIKTCG